MSNEFIAIDFYIVGIYLLLIIGIGLYVSRKRSNTSEYFLADRNVGWFVIGSALFASNIGSEHLVGLAGTGFDSGIAVAQFEILASLILLLLGWFFVPYYLNSKVSTTPEFLERRFSPAARWYLSIISIFAYVVTKIAVTIAAGGIVFEGLMGIDFWTGAFLIVILTGIYTVLGGLKAVVYTETIQAVILLIGSTATLIYGLNAVGGWDQMVSTAGPGFMNIWKPADHPDFPWTGVIFGAPILGIWYWCTDQNIVQRVLSAKNISEARKGTIFAGFLKLTPLFLFVIPGVIAFCLTQPGVPEGVRLDLASKDSALPELVKTLLPSGLKGMVGAALLAALMSSLASVFNSASTLVTLDIYQKLYPNSEEKQLVRFGQLTTIALVAIGLAFIPLIDNFGDTLFVSLQAIQAMVAPPIAAVFLFGIFFKRLNKEGALSSLGVGFVFGMGRFILTNVGIETTPGSLLDLFLNVNFLHFAFYLFVLCTIVLFIVSYSTPGPALENVKGLTYEKKEASEKLTFESVQNMTKGVEDRIYSLLLVVCVVLVWIFFA
ncbi:sodium:solute symporter [Candidatus Marinimicrobia bacterium]|nr:sodium:solute symporter [Candidatus Neomarinimicrobiota bacterium]